MNRHPPGSRLILEGAVPAALIALAAQWLLEVAEKSAVPPGLRQAGRGG